MLKVVKTIQTKENHTVTLYETTNDNYDKTILIVGVFHGEEPQGCYLINKFIQTDLCRIKNKLVIIPCLNPDGMEKNQRQNANGIDLNRSFPTKNWRTTSRKEYSGGEKPNSELETQLMVEVIEEYDFDAILSIHAPFEIVNYDGPAKELAEKISEITGYRVQGDIGYPTPGSFGTYCGVERNIPTITLELDEEVPLETIYPKMFEIFEELKWY